MDGTKRCTKCGRDQPLSEFSPSRQHSDGLQSHCKTCIAAYTRRYYQRNRAQMQQAVRRSQEKNPDYKRNYDRAYYRAHRAAKLARDAVYRALKSGRLVKPDRCERCGVKGPVVAHHADYSKPLEVDWWCRSCHHRHHGRHKAPPATVEMLL